MLTTILASGDNPLGHIVDHTFGSEWLNSLGITYHVVTLLIASALCILTMTYVARQIVSGRMGRLAGLFEVLMVFVRDEVVAYDRARHIAFIKYNGSFTPCLLPVQDRVVVD